MALICAARRMLACMSVVLSAAFALSGARVADAGINQWTSTGPDGGWVNAVAWHPTRGGVLFAAAGHVFRSVDSGAHWTTVSSLGTAQGNFVFDPNNADRILVAGAPVLRSTDGGASFAPAAQFPDAANASLLAIAANGSVVYATSGGRVYRSADFAQSWEERSTGLPGGFSDSPNGLRVSPADPNSVYVSFASAGLFRSTNGGASWTHINLPTAGAGPLAINPNNPSQLLVMSYSSVSLQRSNDAGATWSTVASGFFNFIEFDPLVVNRVVAYENHDPHLYVSTDGGGAWSQAAAVPSVQTMSGSISSTTAGTLAIGTAEGVYVSTDVGQTLTFRSTGLNAADLRSIATSRGAPFRVYASFYGGPAGLFQRVNGGWQGTNTAQLLTALPPRSVISGLAADPNDSAIVYAGAFGGLAKTIDAGSSWSLPSNYFSTSLPYSVAVDPANTQIVYVATQTTGVARSTNGGTSWVARNNGLPTAGSNVPMQYIAIDPSDSQQLYAVQLNTGALYRTVDAGLNWSRVMGGLPSTEQVLTVAFDPLDPNRRYLGTDNGVYRSVDGGGTWSAMSLPVNTRYVASILIDPVAPGTIVLISSNILPVIRTVDYGATWEALPWESPTGDFASARGGVLDPAAPGNLLVGVVARGVRELQVAPNLTISMSGLASQVALGSSATLRVSVQNKVVSQFAASDVLASVTLPAALGAGTPVSTRGSCTRSGQSVNCRLGAMKVGDTAQIDVPLTGSSAPGAGTVTAAVQPREADADFTDNIVTTPVTVRGIADLRAVLDAPLFVYRGATVALQARAINAGPNSADNVRVNLSLPTGLTATSATGPGGACTISGATVSCQTPSIAAGTEAAFQIQATAVTIGTKHETVNVTSDTFDPDTLTNDAVALFSVRPVTDLAVALNTGATSPVTAQSAAATVTVSNLGPDPVGFATTTISGSNLTLTLAAAANGCSITGSTINCSLGSLASGASSVINVNYTAGAVGTAQLTATVDSEASDSPTGNNTISSSITVVAPPAGGGGGTSSGASGGSGGGGALGWPPLLALLGMLARRAAMSAPK